MAAPVAKPPAAPLTQGQTVERWVDGNFGNDILEDEDDDEYFNNCTRLVEPGEEEGDPDVYIYNSCRTISHALFMSNPGDVIRVAGKLGTSYFETLNINEKVTIIGGYAPGFGPQIEPPQFPNIFPTVIQGAVVIRGAAVSFIPPNISGEGPMEVRLETLQVTSGGIDIFSGAVSTFPFPPRAAHQVKVDLEDVVVRNSSDSNGGGLNINGTNNRAILSNVLLRDNSATNGGGLYAGSGSVVELGEGTVIRNNNATNGGGIAASGAFTITASGGVTVTANAASGNGGGVYASASRLNLGSDTVILGNGAAYGGGIYLSGGTNTVSGATINNNSASAHGGAVYASGGAPLLENLTVSQNSAGTGGGLFLTGTNGATISSIDLFTNTATASHGGGYFLSGSNNLTANSLTLQGNRALTDGGGGYVANLNASRIQGNTFTGNMADSNGDNVGAGGGLYVLGGALTLQSNIYSANRGVVGGGLVINASNGTSSGGESFSDNQARYGGAIYLVGNNGTRISGPEITTNQASVQGGGIYATGNPNVTLGATNLVANQSGAEGAGLYAVNSTLVFTSATLIDGNLATGQGGGGFLGAGALLTFESLDLQNNKGREGGGFYANGGRAIATGATSFLANEATNGFGGALYLRGNGGTASRFDNLFAQENKAARGGALYAEGIALTLGTVTLFGNQATGGSGGAAYFVNSALTVTGAATVVDNQTSQHGGGFFAASTILGFDSGATFRGNKAQGGRGGGVYLIGNGHAANFGTIVFSENEASIDGGGIYADKAAVAVAPTSTFESNLALAGSGGAFFVTGASLSLGNVRVKGNRAFINGGGGFLSNGNLSIFAGTVFDDNRAQTGSGGGFAINSATNVLIDNAVFTKNLANSDGGALHLVNSTLRGQNSASFTENSATNGRGGAIFVSGGNGTLDALSFTKNRATTGGGALHITTGSLTLNNNSFSENNGGDGLGGGAYIRASSGVTLTSSIFTKNLANSGAGLYIAETANASLATSQFTENSSSGAGGALAIHLTAARLNALFVRGNQAGSEGGGLYATMSRVDAVNTVIVSNRVVTLESYGAGIFVGNSELSLTHVTIANNSHQNMQGSAHGIYVAPSIAPTGNGPSQSNVTLINSIISGHAVGLNLLAGNSATTNAVLWNNLHFDWTGAGSFTVANSRRGDPRFNNIASNDYHLLRDSAAFDQGISSAVSVDTDGVARTQNLQPDLGAYEHRYEAGLYLTSSLAPAFVDLGDELTIRLRVRNQSASPAEGTILRVTLPIELPAPSISVSNGVDGACQGIFCEVNFGTLPVGADVTIEILVLVAGEPSTSGLINLLSNATLQTANFTTSDTTLSASAYLQNCRVQLNGNVFASVQDAVDAAAEGDTVRIHGACGALHQNDGPGQLLTLNRNVTLQGGWNSDFSVQDPAAFPTYFDSAGLGRVVYINGDFAPVLENLVLRNGSALGLGGGPAGKDAGGGLYVNGGAPTLRNVDIANSVSPDLGAGVYLTGPKAALFQGGFVRNNNAGERGGGFYIDQNAPTLNGVEITGNSARGGGGLYLHRSAAQILDTAVNGNVPTCRIERNTTSIMPNYVSGPGAGGSPVLWLAPGGGGGMVLDESAALVRGCLFNENSARVGGGLYIHNSAATIENNLVTANRARQPNPNAVLFGPGGVGDGDGGGIALDNLNPAAITLRGLLLGSNQAIRGSALFTRLAQPGTLPLAHFTINSNSGGSAVFALGESNLAFNDTIVAFNTGGAALFAQTGGSGESAAITLDRTLWHPSTQPRSASAGDASITTVNDFVGDPAFKNDGYHLKRISFAYGVGAESGAFADRDGNSRPIGTHVELGADEYASALTVRYVAVAGTGNAPCTDYRSPCALLQTALDAAVDGDLIKMAGGVYGSVRNDGGRIHHARIEKSVTIQGGYFPRTDNNAVTEAAYTVHDWEDPHPVENPTVIDVSNQGRVFYITGQVTPTLSLLTLRRGNATALVDTPEGSAGGAIYVDGATPIFEDVVVQDSRAASGSGFYLRNAGGEYTGVAVSNNGTGVSNGQGGAFYIEGGQPTLQNMTIQSNVAVTGAAIYLDNSMARLLENTIQSNGDATTRAGGGIYVSGGEATMISNTVTINQAQHGGGLYLASSNATVRDNSIDNNRASTNPAPTGQTDGLGGGIYVVGGAPQISNNTISNNQVLHPELSLGGGLYLAQTGAALSGNTINNNRAHRGGGIYFAGTRDIVVRDNTISNNAAQATNDTLHLAGGGVYLASAVISFTQNNISLNSAPFGAGLYVAGRGRTQVTQNSVFGNVSGQDGGGVYLDSSDVDFIDNLVQANRTTEGRGGGLYARTGQATLRDNLFVANQATIEGGGVFLSQDGSTLQADLIQDNISGDGAGLYIDGPPPGDLAPAPWINQTQIISNSAGNQGGGLFMRGSGAQFTLNTLRDNQAAVNGGGGVIQNSMPSAFTGNVIQANRADEQGGGLFFSRSSTGWYQSNALIDNSAGQQGGGIFVSASAPILVHTTLARNGSALVAAADQTPATVIMSNTIVSEHNALGVKADFGASVAMYATLWDENAGKLVGPGAFSSSGNYDGAAAFAADGYHLTDTSVAANKGIIDGVAFGNNIGNDVDNEGRFQGGGPELGADELSSGCAIIVQGVPGNVFGNLQAAINAASNDTVLLMAGSCSGMSTVEGPDSAPQLGYFDENITLRGGYEAGVWDVSSPQTHPSVLDARGEGRAIRVAAGFRLILTNVTVINGNAAGLGGGPAGEDAGGNLYVKDGQITLNGVEVMNGQAEVGGGIYLQAPVALVSDSSFRGNSASHSGGAIYLNNAPTSVQVRSSRFATNRAVDGAAIYASAGTPILVSNHFQDNQTLGSSGRGGAIFLGNSNAGVSRNWLEANRAGLGGGLFVVGGAPDLTNNMIIKNVGINDAGALYSVNSPLNLRNNTWVGNGTLQSDGSAILFDTPSASQVLTLTNNIVVDHSRAISVATGNQLSVRANLWFNNQTRWSGDVSEGASNIVENPLFVNAAAGNYRLSETSPAVDSGVNIGVTDDLDGQSRPARQGFDMGADEYLRPSINATLAALPDPVASGDEQTYILQVVNNGDIDLVARVQITLPAELTPLSETVWENVQIARGAIWEQNLNALVDADYTGAISALMAVTSNEGASATSIANSSAATIAGALLEFSGESEPDPAPPGSSVEIRLRVVNRGAIAVNATIEAQLPEGLSTTSPLVFTPTISGPDGVWSTRLQATVDEDVPLHTTQDSVNRLTTQIRVSSDRSAQQTYTITTAIANPSIQISRTPAPNPAIAGKSLFYQLIVTNTGNMPLATTVSNSFADQVALADPAQAQPFQMVLTPGQVWQQRMTTTVEAGYTGPLPGSAQVTTDVGVSANTQDAIMAQRQSLTPDATAVGGDWFNPASWEPPVVPPADAVVLIPEGIFLFSERPITAAGLINHGTLELRAAEDASASQAMTLTNILENYGEIRGRDGTASGGEGAQTGLTLNMASAILYNEGLIRAGNGAADGGDGGDLVIVAGATTNKGILAAGVGGDVTDPAAGVPGGQGGNVLLSFDPGLFTNSEDGRVEAGEGGDSHPNATPPQPGGNGGNVTIVATSAVHLDNSSVFAGEGGGGSNGSTRGLLGQVVVGAPSVSDEGATFSNGTVLVIRIGDDTYNFAAVGPKTVLLSPESRLAIFTVRIFNRGARPDTYVVTPLSVPEGWQVNNLPATLNLNAFRSNIVVVVLTVPNDPVLGAEHQLFNIVITSQRDSGNQIVIPLQIIHSAGDDTFRVQLPQISR